MIEVKVTKQDFSEITKIELYNLWWGRDWWKKPYSDKQIAKMYGVTTKEVKKKRKELGITWSRCAFLSVYGGKAYKK